jgi:cell wall-associated NlpC family hydrolase
MFQSIYQSGHMRNSAIIFFFAMLAGLFATTASAKNNGQGSIHSDPKNLVHKQSLVSTKAKRHKGPTHKSVSGKPHQKKVSLHKPQKKPLASLRTSHLNHTDSRPNPSKVRPLIAATTVKNPATPESKPPNPVSQSQAVATRISPLVLDDKNPISAAQSQASPTPGNALMEAMKKRAEPLLMAMGLLGTPYKLGGTNPEKGVDCSGLVHYVYKQSVNIDLPHSAKELSQNGAPVKLDDLQPGDLVFFHTLKKHFSHVGIYAGDGKFVHADSRQAKVVIVSNIDTHYWARHFDGARRLPLDLPTP